MDLRASTLYDLPYAREDHVPVALVVVAFSVAEFVATNSPVADAYFKFIANNLPGVAVLIVDTKLNGKCNLID